MYKYPLSTAPPGSSLNKKPSGYTAAGMHVYKMAVNGNPSGNGKMNRAEALGIFELEEGATREQMRAPYLRLSQLFHPDYGNTYREYELALPHELSRSAQVALVQRFAEQELGTTRPYLGQHPRG